MKYGREKSYFLFSAGSNRETVKGREKIWKKKKKQKLRHEEEDDVRENVNAFSKLGKRK